MSRFFIYFGCFSGSLMEQKLQIVSRDTMHSTTVDGGTSSETLTGQPGGWFETNPCNRCRRPMRPDWQGRSCSDCQKIDRVWAKEQRFDISGPFPTQPLGIPASSSAHRRDDIPGFVSRASLYLIMQNLLLRMFYFQVPRRFFYVLLLKVLIIMFHFCTGHSSSFPLIPLRFLHEPTCYARETDRSGSSVQRLSEKYTRQSAAAQMGRFAHRGTRT